MQRPSRKIRTRFLGMSPRGEIASPCRQLNPQTQLCQRTSDVPSPFRDRDFRPDQHIPRPPCLGIRGNTPFSKNFDISRHSIMACWEPLTCTLARQGLCLSFNGLELSEDLRPPIAVYWRSPGFEQPQRIRDRSRERPRDHGLLPRSDARS